MVTGESIRVTWASFAELFIDKGPLSRRSIIDNEFHPDVMIMGRVKATVGRQTGLTKGDKVSWEKSSPVVQWLGYRPARRRPGFKS